MKASAPKAKPVKASPPKAKAVTKKPATPVKAKTSSPAVPKDKVQVTGAKDEKVRSSVNSLIGSLESDAKSEASETSKTSGDGEAAKAEATASSNGENKVSNPYEGFSERSVKVKTEAWSKDRTPAEGQVSRNDHMIGMLRNQGYSQADIYKKDENGKNLLDRVSEANNIKDPNLIHTGQELVLPTRLKEAKAEADAKTEGDKAPAEATAKAETKTGDLKNQKAKSEAKAEAQTKGDESPAVAKAEAKTETGNLDKSTATSDAKAKATTEGDKSPALAEAKAETKTGDLKDSKAESKAAAEAETKGDKSTAVSEAKAKTETGNLDNSVAASTAKAEAKTSGDQAPAVADTKAETKTGNLKGSTATSEATAKAETKGEESPALAKAEAETSAEEIEKSKVEVKAKAEAAATGVDSPAGVEASTKAKVEKAVESIVESKTEAIAQGPEGKTEALAQTEVEVKEAKQTEIATATKAKAETVQPESPAPVVEPKKPVEVKAKTNAVVQDAQDVEVREEVDVNDKGGTAKQELVIGDNKKAAVTQQTVDAVEEGSDVDASNTKSKQEADFAGVGPAGLGQTSDAEKATQRVEKHDTKSDPFSGTRFDDTDLSFTEQRVSEGDNSSQRATGVRNVRQIADGRKLATMGSDAQNGRYEGTGNERININHTGVDGTASVNVDANDLYFRDSPHNGPRMHSDTGNRVALDARSDKARIDAERSESVNGRLQGQSPDGDSHHTVKLPEGKDNNLVVQNEGGKDFLRTEGGASNLVVSKTDGEMKMSVQAGKAESSEVLLDTGKAALTGTVDLSKVDKSTVQLRGTSADTNAVLRAGKGKNDTLVVNLKGDEIAPRIVTEEAGTFSKLFGGEDKDANGGQPTQGRIVVDGFENVVFIRDGKLVKGAGFGSQDVESFDDATRRVIEAASRG